MPEQKHTIKQLEKYTQWPWTQKKKKKNFAMVWLLQVTATAEESSIHSRRADLLQRSLWKEHSMTTAAVRAVVTEWELPSRCGEPCDLSQEWEKLVLSERERRQFPESISQMWISTAAKISPEDSWLLEHLISDPTPIFWSHDECDLMTQVSRFVLLFFIFWGFC